MTGIERAIYRSFGHYALNQALLPVKLLVPQPFIQKIPFLTTNEEIRISIVLRMVSGRLLDIGCGSNELVRRYRERGGDGIGVDVYPWDGADMILENTSKLPFPDQAFDTITFIACINHIPNRADVLREAKRLPQKRGRIILTNLTPGLSQVWHRYAFWDADQHERGMAEGEVWGFKHRQLVELLKAAGFSLVLRKRISWGLNNLYVFS